MPHYGWPKDRAGLGMGIPREVTGNIGLQLVSQT